MKLPKSTGNTHKAPAQSEREGGIPNLSSDLAAKLTPTWGPTLAFIAFVAVSGIVGIQIARSDVMALAISLIVVVALIAGLTARIKNVL
jgi:hypothetical protein